MKKWLSVALLILCSIVGYSQDTARYISSKQEATYLNVTQKDNNLLKIALYKDGETKILSITKDKNTKIFIVDSLGASQERNDTIFLYFYAHEKESTDQLAVGIALYSEDIVLIGLFREDSSVTMYIDKKDNKL